MRCFAVVLIAPLAAAVTAQWASAAEHPSFPPSAGLVLWLDASDPATLTLVDGTVTAWRDKSSLARACLAEGRGTARHVADGANGHAMVRFDGGATFATDVTHAGKPAQGPVNVFVVSRRLPDQAGGPQWQRIVSSWNGSGRDNAAPNFSVTADRDGNAGPYGPVIDHASRSDVTLAKLRIGGSAQFDGHFLRGDLAEVLIYDREFLTFEDDQAVYRYLAAKWAAPLPPGHGWTRRGPLGATPQRVTDAFPLSDQANTLRWVRHERIGRPMALRQASAEQRGP